MSPQTDDTADLGIEERRNVRNQILKLQKSLHGEEFQESVPNVPNGPVDQDVGSTDAMISERKAQREAANCRRRETRAAARRDFADARKVGLQRRQASRLREASTEEKP